MNEKQIIEGCLKHNAKAQKMLFETYAGFLLAVCMRYAGNRSEAEDIMQEVFIKIFFNIKEYSGSGSFKGWLRKIAVNTAITYYHRNLKYRLDVDIDDYVSLETGTAGFEDDFYTSDELFRILNELPAGYRMVFNLYAVEGYKHREIAEMLGIDTNTSKSQYSRARAYIRAKLEELSRLKSSYNG